MTTKTTETDFTRGDFICRKFMLALFLTISGIAVNAQTPAQSGRDFNINIPQSKVEFFVGSSAGDVNGVFQSWSGKLHQTTPGVPQSATLNIEVSADTMRTGSGMKDKMVKGKKFFDVKNFPMVSFTSTNIIPSSDPNKFQVQGNFTLRGVTKPVVLQVTLDRDKKGGGQVYGDLSFDRRDFGMTKNVPFVHVSDSVRVRLDLYVEPVPVATAAQAYSWTKVVRIKVSN
jgi:polyisoprenoid-binding protein YceI